MFNLIKRDIKIIVKNENNNIFKHIVIFWVLYLGFNNISYSSISILISYLIVTDMFYSSEQEWKNKSIKSLPNINENDVYARYIVAMLMIIITNAIIILIVDVLSNILFRGIVLNDIILSLNVFLIIMSFILPIFFKYGYYKARFSSGTIGIIIYCVYGSFMNMLSDRIYEIRYFITYQEKITLNECTGAFSKMIGDIVYGIDLKYLNLYVITVITILIFILSMYISTRIIKKVKL